MTAKLKQATGTRTLNEVTRRKAGRRPRLEIADPKIGPPSAEHPSTAEARSDAHEDELDISANLAVWDRALRILFGGLFLYLGWGAVVTGGAGTVLKVVGFFLVASGLLGWSLVYTLLEVRTRKAAIPAAARE